MKIQTQLWKKQTKNNPQNPGKKSRKINTFKNTSMFFS